MIIRRAAECKWKPEELDKVEDKGKALLIWGSLVDVVNDALKIAVVAYEIFPGPVDALQQLSLEVRLHYYYNFGVLQIFEVGSLRVCIRCKERQQCCWSYHKKLVNKSGIKCISDDHKSGILLTLRIILLQ